MGPSPVPEGKRVTNISKQSSRWQCYINRC